MPLLTTRTVSQKPVRNQPGSVLLELESLAVVVRKNERDRGGSAAVESVTKGVTKTAAGPLLGGSVTEETIALTRMDTLIVANFGVAGGNGVENETGLAGRSAGTGGVGCLAAVQFRGGSGDVIADVTIATQDALGLVFCRGHTDEIADALVQLVGIGGAGESGEIGGGTLCGDVVSCIAVGGAIDHFRSVQLVGNGNEMAPNVRTGEPGAVRVQATTVVGVDIPREATGVVRGENTERSALLLEVVGASDTLRLGFGFGQSGEKHTGKNRDNRDDHQKLNQRKCGVPRVTSTVHRFLWCNGVVWRKALG